MSRTSVYKSGVKAAIHQTARDLYDGGVIDKQTMRRFDESCLTPVHEFTAEEIRALRKREEVSQSVFAHYPMCRRILSASGSGDKRNRREHR